MDDDPIVIAVVTEWLLGAGHRVSSRTRAMGTSQWVLEHQPDVLLLDVRMPGISGGELAQLIGKNSRTQHVAVILHSAMPPAELDSLVNSTGALGALRKTPLMDQFMSSFDRLTQQRRAPRR